MQVSYGLERLDHAVGNVPELIPQVEYMAKAFGAFFGCARGVRHASALSCFTSSQLPGWPLDHKLRTSPPPFDA